MEYAAHRISQPAATRANHWIYGNEVDVRGSWHNLGLISANAAGNLAGTATVSDPQIGNNNFFDLERDSERFLIRMKTDSGSRGEIFWGIQAANNYQPVRKFGSDTIAGHRFHLHRQSRRDRRQGRLAEGSRLQRKFQGSGFRQPCQR